MIGTIRKHSGWLWWLIAAATIISFVWWGVGPASRNAGGRNAVNSDVGGSIYGQKITEGAYDEAKREVYLFFLFNYGEWPDKNPNITKEDLRREIYVRMMLVKKADDVGIVVGDDAAAAAANEMLRSPRLAQALGMRGESVPLGTLMKQVLQPKGLDSEDFENFVRHSLAIEQLQETLGLAGGLVTPQEAAGAYQQENQEFSAQIVFFSASNYLSQVAATPAAVAQFYTNYLANYRLPDRVRVSYVAFEATNFIPQARMELTNLDQIVENFYLQHGAEAFHDAKTPDEAKAKIREIVFHQQALADARKQANEFASAVFNFDPDKPSPENLAAVAGQKRLAVHVTAPFSSEYGPEEFSAPPEFTKAAFQLSSDEPFAGPITGQDAVYVIALAGQLPSEIPPLDGIRALVTRDFQMQQAVALAQSAGTNFVRNLAGRMAGGKSFASACVAAGLTPEVLPPFSLSTQELPELGGRLDLDHLKQAVISTPVGKTSGFEETSDGGFVLFVQSQLPVDTAKMNADLPQFTAQLRRTRQNEAFSEWVQLEANRELRDTPIFHPQAAAGAE